MFLSLSCALHPSIQRAEQKFENEKMYVKIINSKKSKDFVLLRAQPVLCPLS